MVEFALVAPVVLLIIGATVDMGRGMLMYALLQGASRDMARQTALGYYSGSNTLPPDCTALTTPCGKASIVNGAHLLDSLGATVMYADSGSISAAPAAYGNYAGGSTTSPGTVTLSGVAVRTGGHQLAVVDLKLQWQPVLARFLGIPTLITFDSQTVIRMES